MCVITPPVSDDEHVRDTEHNEKRTNEPRRTDLQSGGSVLMSATVGTSKMEVINGQDKNLYATVQQVLPTAASKDKPPVATSQSSSIKISPLSGVLGKLRGVLPGKKHAMKNGTTQELSNADSGDYVTIADVRNNNDKRPAGLSSPSSSSSSDMTTVRSTITYANSDIFKKDAEYVSLSELPKKPDSSLERKRQGARVTLDSEGKVVYSSDSLKRRKGAHTTFNPGILFQLNIASFARKFRDAVKSFATESVAVWLESFKNIADPFRSSVRSIKLIKSPSKIYGFSTYGSTNNAELALSRDVSIVTGPFVREGASPSPSPLLHRAMPNIRAVTKSGDATDGPPNRTPTPPMSPQLGKLIIRAARSPDRAASPDYVRTPTTVVGPTSPTSLHRQVRGAYVNVQGDEGKTSSNGDEHRDCTGCTGRLEAPCAASRSKDEFRSVDGPTVALAPSNKLPQPDKLVDKTRICHGGSQLDRSRRKADHDENHPPEFNGDAPENVRACAPLKTSHSVSVNPANSRLDFEKSVLYPKILRATGNTPKLNRKLLISDLDTPSFRRRRSEADDRKIHEENAMLDDCTSANKSTSVDSAESDDQTSKKPNPMRDDRADRKVKRSESYRMANSPIMFIKKFSASNVEKSSKICRTPSEELQEELLRERINYPETVSSPEPQIGGKVTFDTNRTATASIQSGPTSPRPRALDLEPARVLKYSSNDTEIW